MGKTLRNVLAQAADAHHHLGLIFDTAHVVGDEERLVVLEQSGVGFQENDRFLWFR